MISARYFFFFFLITNFVSMGIQWFLHPIWNFSILSNYLGYNSRSSIKSSWPWSRVASWCQCAGLFTSVWCIYQFSHLIQKWQMYIHTIPTALGLKRPIDTRQAVVSYAQTGGRVRSSDEEIWSIQKTTRFQCHCHYVIIPRYMAQSYSNLSSVKILKSTCQLQGSPPLLFMQLLE